MQEKVRARQADKLLIPVQYGRRSFAICGTSIGAVTAIATVFIAAFTIVLTRVTGRQATLTHETLKLTHETLRLAREEFIASHRPRIILRNVIFDAEQMVFWLANIGDTRATIVESRIQPEFVPDGTRFRPRPTGHHDLGQVILEGGETREFTYHGHTPAQFAGTPGSLYFAGTIVYADDNGVKHQSAFRRRWSPEGFMRLQDERDQEYVA
jgi:hypothetical protein